MLHAQQGDAGWRTLRSGANAGAVIVAVAVIYFLTRGYFIWAVLGGVVALLLLRLASFAYRQSLGWVIDDSGERQKVIKIVSGEAGYVETTHEQRRKNEKSARDGRVWAYKACGFGIPATLAATAYWITAYDRMANIGYFVVGVFLFVILAMLTIALLLTLGKELLYQSGFQDMVGAKVLDPKPQPISIEDVAREKAYGDSGIVAEEDVYDVLNPRRKS